MVPKKEDSPVVSSSRSPIYKAPDPRLTKLKEEPEAPMPNERCAKQEYLQSRRHLQMYCKPIQQVSVAPQPAMPPALGQMQVLGPDGTPMRLVLTSVPGPYGKMIQVMQVVQPRPCPAMPQASVPPSAPVSHPKQTYRMPPPLHYILLSLPLWVKYPVPPSITTSAANPSEMYRPEGFMDDLPGYEDMAEYPKAQTAVPVNVKEVPLIEKEPYRPSNHTSILKKMEMVGKQKRRQEVLKTIFTQRPARSWAKEVKQETGEEMKSHQKRTKS